MNSGKHTHLNISELCWPFATLSWIPETLTLCFPSSHPSNPQLYKYHINFLNLRIYYVRLFHKIAPLFERPKLSS